MMVAGDSEIATAQQDVFRAVAQRIFHVGAAQTTWQFMKADDPLYLTWFNAGLRIVDWSNPFEPKEIGYSA